SRQPVRDFAYSTIGAEGRVLYCRTIGRPVFDGDGRFKGYLFATRNETAVVEARAKAGAAEELLSRAFESISDGIAIYDSNDRLTLTNSRYKSLFLQGLPLDPTGKTFEELVRYDLAQGYYAEAAGREEEFVQERLAAHRRSGSSLLYKTSEG